MEITKIALFKGKKIRIKIIDIFSNNTAKVIEVEI